MLPLFAANPEEKQDVQPERTILVAKSELKHFPSEIYKPSEQIRYENLSEDERKLCEFIATKYKSEIEQCPFWTEDVILRFVTDTYYVKDYQQRLELTCTRFAEFLDHYHQYHFDDILTNPELNTPQKLQIVEEDNDILPSYYYGIDHEGHPILWNDGSMFGKFKEIKEAFCSGDGNSNGTFQRACYQRSRIKRMEANLWINIGRHYGGKINKSIFVADFSKASMADYYENRDFHHWNMKTSSRLFPETMHKIFVINAPLAFRFFYQICKTFLDQITVEKTVILGEDYLKEMVKYIDIKMIPKQFGGEGIWTPRNGNVPIDFPFQMNEIEIDEEDPEDKDKDNDDDDDAKDPEEKDGDEDDEDADGDGKVKYSHTD